MKLTTKRTPSLSAFDLIGAELDLVMHEGSAKTGHYEYEVSIKFDYYKTPKVTWFDNFLGRRWRKVYRNTLIDRKTDLISEIHFTLSDEDGYSGLIEELDATLNSAENNIWASRANCRQVAAALRENKNRISDYVWECLYY